MSGSGTSNIIRTVQRSELLNLVGHFNRDLAMPRHSPRHGTGLRLYRRSEPEIRSHAGIYIPESSSDVLHSQELDIEENRALGVSYVRSLYV